MEEEDASRSSSENKIPCGRGAGGSTIVHSSAGSDSSDNGGGGRLCGAYGAIRTAREDELRMSICRRWRHDLSGEGSSSGAPRRKQAGKRGKRHGSSSEAVRHAGGWRLITTIVTHRLS